MTAPNRDDRLQQYFDGELPPAEARELEQLLESDDALRAKLDGLSHLHELMTASADALGAEVDSDALFARIQAGVDEGAEDDEPMFPGAAEPAAEPARAPLRVVEGGKKETPAVQPADERGNGLWIGLGVLAAAAAVLFFVLRDAGDPPSTASNDSGSNPPEVAPTAIAEAEPPPGSEIEEVDFGYSTGAIFAVEGTEGEQYAVVWISDEKIDTEDREVVQ